MSEEEAFVRTVKVQGSLPGPITLHPTARGNIRIWYRFSQGSTDLRIQTRTMISQSGNLKKRVRYFSTLESDDLVKNDCAVVAGVVAGSKTSARRSRRRPTTAASKGSTLDTLNLDPEQDAWTKLTQRGSFLRQGSHGQGRPRTAQDKRQTENVLTEKVHQEPLPSRIPISVCSLTMQPSRQKNPEWWRALALLTA